MKRVYLVSKCIKVREKTAIFHFIGYIDGHRINKVCVLGGSFVRGKEYLVRVEEVVINKSVLTGQCRAQKELFI